MNAEAVGEVEREDKEKAQKGEVREGGGEEGLDKGIGKLVWRFRSELSGVF